MQITRRDLAVGLLLLVNAAKRFGMLGV